MWSEIFQLLTLHSTLFYYQPICSPWLLVIAVTPLFPISNLKFQILHPLHEIL